ncbi:uncharacterized protein NPIL_587361 [Nephila pilipes]|uniref:C-type lectin domain-containing protein n=1 Tax=Nephila pilipes TaxID=299642 RepID=A0A8X6NLJ3_NEPPI|nr:uncharacterized protein NPIL_587361 [Nephila pilipes]
MHHLCSLYIMLFVLCKLIEGCPSDFFRASNITCLHIAQPTLGLKKEYCDTIGSELFGRPLTEEMQEALSNEMKAQAEKWMPTWTFVGLERQSSHGMGTKSELWNFYDEDEVFHQSKYELWNKEPTNEDDCAAVGLESDFKVEQKNCLDSYALICNKNEFPCEDTDSYYSNYDGFCLAVVKDLKSYPNAVGSCLDGQLLKMRNLSYVEPVTQTFYNSKFSGGIYIGLKLNDNEQWIYENGEEEPDVQTPYTDDELKCGAVRLLEDTTLRIYSHLCAPERLWFLCEVTRKYYNTF